MQKEQKKMSKKSAIRIGDNYISRQHAPYIVAEMSGNHNQSIDRAMKIVEAAAQSGVHALKLQTYTADTITLDINEGKFFINDPESLWKGQSLHSFYRKAYTPWEWHEEIFRKCQKMGLSFFSTPFDETAVDFLESLNVPAYKISSFETVHLPLIRKVAATGKPIILSTGMASISELDEAVQEIRKAGNKDLILLKCTSNYPAMPNNVNILTIPHMRKLFDCNVGLSDHSVGVGIALAAIAHGAVMIEKHFTLRRDDGGVDSPFSMEPEEMKMLSLESHKAWSSLGDVQYGPTESEKQSIAFRQSIYVSSDTKKGELFTKKNLRIVRPGSGLPPKYYDLILGKRASKNLKKGTPFEWDFFKNA